MNVYSISTKSKISVFSLSLFLSLFAAYIIITKVTTSSSNCIGSHVPIKLNFLLSFSFADFFLHSSYIFRVITRDRHSSTRTLALSPTLPHPTSISNSSTYRLLLYPTDQHSARMPMSSPLELKSQKGHSYRVRASPLLDN